VLTPAEIKEPHLRGLQEKYLDQLQTLGTEVQAHVYPYSFYFSRVLDLDLAQQPHADQRSLRFDVYGGMTVIQLTANYFASYSSVTVDKSHRALRTFQDVMLPILEIATPVMANIPDAEGFAMEVSHRVRGKAMGMNMERPENLVFVVPKSAATRLVNAKSESDRQAAILDGQFFINGEPFILYLSDRAAEEAARTPEQNSAPPSPSPDTSRKAKSKSSNNAAAQIRPFPSQSSEPPPPPPRDTSPESLAKIQASYQKMIDLVMKELESQAHFVSYSPAAMVAFRKNAYLEFSVNSMLTAATGSRYRMAALAFDDHIARLIRPAMAYFKGDLDFDGIAFSTTIHQSDKAAAADGNEAVEFFFPVDALRCYESYDCTGQDLIDKSYILINGERVTLDLQVAEGSTR
jgi:hypothetical protein